MEPTRFSRSVSTYRLLPRFVAFRDLGRVLIVSNQGVQSQYSCTEIGGAVLGLGALSSRSCIAYLLL